MEVYFTSLILNFKPAISSWFAFSASAALVPLAVFIVSVCYIYHCNICSYNNTNIAEKKTH